jgi:hypothetical protein
LGSPLTIRFSLQGVKLPMGVAEKGNHAASTFTLILPRA